MSSKANVVVTIEIGHKATVRHQKTPDGFTHDWEVFVQGTDGAHIENFVEKVVFYLHSSFAKPRRVCKKPPYTVSEHGYGGFTLPVEVHFRSSGEPQRANFDYDLYLQSIESSPIANTRREKLTFISPADDFRKKLLQGGGMEVTNGQDSRVNEKSSVSRPSSGAKTKPVVRHHTSAAPSNHNSELDKKKPKVEPKKEVTKPKGLKADPFAALFGEIIKTGSDQKLMKDKSSKDKDKNKEKEKSKDSSKKDKDKRKDVKSPEKDQKKDKEHKKSHKDKDREKEKSKKKETHEKKHIEIDKHSSREKLTEKEISKKDNKEVKKEPLKRPLSPPPSTLENKKRKPDKKKIFEPPEKKEKFVDVKPKEKKIISEKEKISEKFHKDSDKVKEREKPNKSSIAMKMISPVTSPHTLPTQVLPSQTLPSQTLPPLLSPKKGEKAKAINSVKPKPEKPSRPRGRPSKEAQRRAAEALSPPPPPSPPPSVVAKPKSKPIVTHHPPPAPLQPAKIIQHSRSKSRSQSPSSRSRSPSLSISSSSSPDHSRSSSQSSRSSSRGSRQNSRSYTPSKSRSGSSSRSRSRSSSSSAKSRSKSPLSVKSHTPSRSISRSRSKSKSIPGSGSCSSSCASSPSRSSKVKREVKESVKPLQLLGINDCSSDSDEKHSHPKSPPIKKLHKGKGTPSSSKSSPRQPHLLGKTKPSKTPNPISSSDDSDSDSSPHPVEVKDVRQGVKTNSAAVPFVKASPSPSERPINPALLSNGRLKSKEEPTENLPIKNESHSKIDFSQDYFGELLELRDKIITSFSDRSKVQEIVNIIGSNASYQLSQAHFTFDLCSLDQQTIKKLQICLS